MEKKEILIGNTWSYIPRQHHIIKIHCDVRYTFLYHLTSQKYPNNVLCNSKCPGTAKSIG